jgi:flagellar biosynthetic protein FlhB
MAAEDAGDKTEQPTPRRRQEAREEGQVARSQDLTAAISLLGGLLVLRLVGPRMMESMYAMTRALGDPPEVTASGLAPWTAANGRAAMEMLVPFLLLIVTLTALGSIAQSGLLLTWKKLSLKPDRLNPVSGFKRVFSGEALTRLVIGLFKVSVLVLLSYLTISGEVSVIIGAGALHVGGVFTRAADMIFDLALRIGVALLILGLVDYFVQRWKLEKQLRMTKQEVRDELKRMEGDPLLKHRRRQMQARLAMQRIHAEVPRADVVVTNPTEYAVAIRYDEATMNAPRVVAKGKDFLAARIRQVAQQYGVPLVQRPPLARALYAGVEVGHEVPPAFYRAVAEVLAYVYQLSGKVA